jgi:hypothetical protein
MAPRGKKRMARLLQDGVLQLDRAADGGTTEARFLTIARREAELDQLVGSGTRDTTAKR